MDFINKLSTRIITEYDIICIEDLKVDNMLKNHNLAPLYRMYPGQSLQHS